MNNSYILTEAEKQDLRAQISERLVENKIDDTTDFVNFLSKEDLQDPNLVSQLSRLRYYQTHDLKSDDLAKILTHLTEKERTDLVGYARKIDLNHLANKIVIANSIIDKNPTITKVDIPYYKTMAIPEKVSVADWTDINRINKYYEQDFTIEQIALDLKDAIPEIRRKMAVIATISNKEFEKTLAKLGLSDKLKAFMTIAQKLDLANLALDSQDEKTVELLINTKERLTVEQACDVIDGNDPQFYLMLGRCFRKNSKLSYKIVKDMTGQDFDYNLATFNAKQAQNTTLYSNMIDTFMEQDLYPSQIAWALRTQNEQARELTAKLSIKKATTERPTGRVKMATEILDIISMLRNPKTFVEGINRFYGERAEFHQELMKMVVGLRDEELLLQLKEAQSQILSGEGLEPQTR